ncbi:NADP-dependent oxidoreductase [Streptomyces flavotricini]|uniref:NADP-dependent oxidoreductase n=1 Tax=Streptomyces flavotricini TaxID=66888 RepID=A0ABS8DZG6_9ACTN|nr:NADP-dependent oxidoreductase [Streptomyces flavotricini]MCC0094039.1 NADP-dependent oxidoreductase [Streptomyces flavotricini]
MYAFAIDGFDDTPALRDLPTPLPGPGEIQIKVRAAGINPLDWKIAAGQLAGSGAPHAFPLTLGIDVAGQVTAVGEGVDAFTAGEEIFGMAWPHTFRHGSFAQYMTAPQDAALAARPSGLDPVSAAALPMTGGTALATLDWLDLKAGETLLVIGATGGVGSYAIQLAAAAGVRVIATAAAEDHAYARGLGAAETIDYRTTDTADAVAAAHPDGIDAILDLAGTAEALNVRLAPLLRPGARVVSTVFSADPDALATRDVKAVNFFYQAEPADMARLAELVTTGRLRVADTTSYPLSHIADAHAASTTGHVRGKLVVTNE